MSSGCGITWQALWRIRWMVLHATGGEPFESPEALADRLPGWPIYHWLIYEDGQIVRCAPPSRVLYHCDGKNVGTVSLAVVGDFSDARVPGRIQVEAVADLFSYTRRYLLAQLSALIGHCELAAGSACPGDWWVQWITEFRKREGHTPETRRVRIRDARERVHAI